MIQRLVRLIMIGLVVVLGACRSDEGRRGQSEKPQYGGTIIAFGDSLTAGQGLDESLSYPRQLQKKLDADGRKYRVINAGISAETSSDALSRLDWVLSQKPDVIIVETGANDGLRGLDPAVPRKNIDDILTRLEQQGVTTVFVGMKMVWNLGPIYVSQFNSIYPELAKKHAVLFMPFFLDGVAMVPALNTPDGIHPNEQGYAKIVGNLYPLVVQAIEIAEKKKRQ